MGPNETMEEYLGSVVALPIDFNRPMWEWTFVSKPDTNEHVLVVRVHHVVGDGVALMTLLNHLLGKVSERASEGANGVDGAVEGGGGAR